MTEREFATDIVRTLQQAGYKALWAGGCVRDELLGLTPNDYDVATDARPEQVQKLFRHTVAVGAAFGVIEVVGPRGKDGEFLTVEVATFRSDGAYIDGRRPESVVFSSPELDAQRRDFTINGMFFDPLANELIDYVGGQRDLDAKVLRAIGDATARFTEDKLRVLRAVRIASRFGLTIDPGTLAAGRRIAPEITVVSAERIAEELRKMLVHPNRVRGWELLRDFELNDVILPELRGRFDTGVVSGLEEPTPPTPFPRREGGAEPTGAKPPLRCGEGVGGGVSFPLALAAVLSALDKPTVEAIADRLKLSSAEKVRAAWLVEMRDFLLDAATMRPSKLYPMLVHPGVGDLLALNRAMGASHVEFCERVLRDTPPEVLNPTPLVTGEDLIAAGMKPGPAFKRILDAVRAAQLDGQLTTKEEALRFARQA
jgi:poly(A) polymerase